MLRPVTRTVPTRLCRFELVRAAELLIPIDPRQPFPNQRTEEVSCKRKSLVEDCLIGHSILTRMLVMDLSTYDIDNRPSFAISEQRCGVSEIEYNGEGGAPEQASPFR